MTPDLTALRLNPALDLAPYAAIYRERGMVQIPAVFDEASASALSRLLTQQTPWRLTFVEGDRPMSYAPEGIDEIGKDAFQSKMRHVLDRARNDVGYCFLAYPMSQAYGHGWDQGHPIHSVTEFINSADFLGLGRAVTGEVGIRQAEAMATLYAPGHFLVRHIDKGAEKERRAAYVLGFTPDWRPDWGGLLLFYDERRDVTGGFTPRFNVITIFNTKFEHAVTQVANFAGAGRYSISGWFRDDGP